MVVEMKGGWVEKGRGIFFIFLIDFSNFLFNFFGVLFCCLYVNIYIYMYIYVYICFCLVGKYEVKSCCTREFRGERRNQGWRGGLTSTTRDGIFWGG